MTIKVAKFGSVLTSRQAGKEAYAAFLPTLKGLDKKEEITIDFDGVSTFSPSWGDEFITPLQKYFGDNLCLLSTDNPSVSLTLSLLERTNNFKLKFRQDN